jgi:hypothetical protein
VISEEAVDGREIELYATCCHCALLSHPCDIAGDLHGVDFERVDTRFSAELDETGEGGTVFLVGFWLESRLEQ